MFASQNELWAEISQSRSRQPNIIDLRNAYDLRIDSAETLLDCIYDEEIPEDILPKFQSMETTTAE